MGKRKPRQWGEVRSRRDRPGFRVRFTHEGRTYERAAGSSWAGADKKRRQVQTLLESGLSIGEVLAHVFGDFHGAKLTFREAAPLYLEYAATRKKPSTLKGDTQRLRLLCTGRWAGKVLGRIQPSDFLPWLAERQKPRKRTVKKRVVGKDGKRRTVKTEKTVPGASGATLNRDLALASAVFAWAVRAGYVDSNPVRKVERFDEKGRERETYLTSDEARALVASCSPVLRPLVLAALHTGMRRGELLALKWRAVDLDRRELLVEPQSEKSGRGRMIPLTDALYDELAELKAARPRPALDGSDPVFTARDGSPMTRSSVQYAFPITVRRCEDLPLAKRGRVTFHSLRHSAASFMVASGVPLFDVAKILGHSTLAVTMRYAHFAPEAGRAAITALGNALAGESGPRREARKG